MITLATEAAKQAGEVLRANFGRASLQVTSKGPSDYVTEADRRSEDCIRQLLAKEVPEHDLLLEESGETGVGAEYRWVVDPLDGTTNYIHRYPFFCVSIALERRGRRILGVVYDPLRAEMFTAEEGEATCLNGIAQSVSRTDRLDQALLCTGFPFREKAELGRYLEAFGAMLTVSGDMRRDGSAALDLAYVAVGRLDGFWELGLSPWDVAAGEVLIRQAGGRVTDFAGDEPALLAREVVASNGRLQEAMTAVTGRVFRPARG